MSFSGKVQIVLRINNGCYCCWWHTPNGDIDLFVEFPFIAGIPRNGRVVSVCVCMCVCLLIGSFQEA